MKKLTEIERLANKLVKAFLKNKIIAPVPLKYAKNINLADKLRKLCESKITRPVVGFKAGGTAIPILKKLREKEPFYASIYNHNFLKNGRTVKVNKYTLGIELEVCFLIKKEFFKSNGFITMKNISKYITSMASCIEIVGYRQRKKGLKYLGDICGDFGANVKFIIGQNKKYAKINFRNLKTNIVCKSSMQSVNGNTNSVYKNPLNSCRFVLNKLKKDKIKLDHNFYVFTGSTVGVVPIKKKGIFIGKIEKLGSVTTKII